MYSWVYAVTAVGRQSPGMSRPDAIVALKDFNPTTTSVRIGGGSSGGIRDLNQLCVVIHI
jgi:hypothetical protein